MPDADGQFKGAAFPHVPWTTEADRRQQRQETSMTTKELIQQLNETARLGYDPEIDHPLAELDALADRKDADDSHIERGAE